MSHFSSTFSTTVPFVGKLPVDWGAKDATHSSRTLIINTLSHYLIKTHYELKPPLNWRSTIWLEFSFPARSGKDEIHLP